jgi:peptide deformylase
MAARVGLAANQVGVSKQVAVIDVGARDEKSPLFVLINPEIVNFEGEVEAEEGCLSVPDYTTVVKRAMKVCVKGLDRNACVEIEAEASGKNSMRDYLNGCLSTESAFINVPAREKLPKK